ncbi:MAG: hypothetical protein KDI79_23375, partial [Anaerolineae bacterium]|nr:hypothetical protein [Anaerolineae bacterium]
MILKKLTKLTLLLSSITLLTLIISLIPPSQTELNGASPTNFSTITYELDWDWGDAVLTSDGWFVTNDRGFQIHVQRGYLVNRSLELIECTGSDATGESITGRLRQTLAAQPAYAGHGGVHDTSRITAPLVESLTKPVAQAVETILVTAPNYCQLHYLVAPGIETARYLPHDVEMMGVTLWLEGDYLAPGTSTSVPFTIQTHLAWGEAVELMTSASESLDTLQRDNVALQITVRRDLASLFDGVDFEAMSDIEQAKTVLRSLTQNTDV